MANIRKWKSLLPVCAVLMVLSAVAMAPQPKHLTMIVVPARFSVLQVAFDVADRHPAVIVTYQGDATTEQPLLHAWNGREWAFVAIEDYEQARFLQRIPAQTILVGDETQLPEVLITASSWCPMVMSIPSIDTATLINSFGKVFGFSSRQWRWFARRYNLTLLDLNARERKESWYDRTMAENLRVSEQTDVELYDEIPMSYMDAPEEEVIEDADMDEEAPEVDLDALEPAPMEEPLPVEEPGGELDEPDMSEDVIGDEPDEWEEQAVAPIPSTIK